MTILTSLIGPVTGLLDKFIEDKDKKNAIAFELSTMAEKHAQELAKGQIEVNKALFTSICPLASSCACFSAIVLSSNAIAFFLSLSSMNLSNSPVTGPINEVNIVISVPQ